MSLGARGGGGGEVINYVLGGSEWDTLLSQG